MEKDLFIYLRAQLNSYLPEIQDIRLYNNQFERSNGTDKDNRIEAAFNYPCIFIEFEQFNHRDLSMGIQEYDVNLTLHIGFKSYQTEDLDILDLKERIYYVTQRFQQGNYARLSRISEEWDYDHDNISILKMTFRTYGKDTFRYVLGDKTIGYITGITETIVYTNELSGGTGYDSSIASENGANMFDGELPEENNCE
jgi:hypothetical protein